MSFNEILKKYDNIYKRYIISKYNCKIKFIITIQKYIRGYLERKIKDDYTKPYILLRFNNYIDEIHYVDNINKLISKKAQNKKIRHPNVHSDLSENIAKIALYKYYKI